MTDDRAPEDGRLSKFSNADRNSYLPRHLETKPVEATQPPPPPVDVPGLADLLEHAIRDGGLRQPNEVPSQLGWPKPQADPPESLADGPRLVDTSLRQGQGLQEELPTRLFEELQAATDQVWPEPPPEYRVDLISEDEVPHVEFNGASSRLPAVVENNRQVRRRASELYAKAREVAAGPLAAKAKRYGAVSGRFAARSAKNAARASVKVARRTRVRDWRRRYLALLSVAHRHLFDRRVERLLFRKTAPLKVYDVTETEKGREKAFVYDGPIPRKVFDWAMAALPADLRHYAFVDFRAGHGRTLLLAAKLNIEYAAGYVYDAQSGEDLEMNLAQYPRSYLTCRDLRALRGDRDGIVIPPQPAILFFPGSLRPSHLEIILNYVSASFRLQPRPIYLIFENAGPERGLDALEIFEKVSLPPLGWMKAALFSPVPVTIYRSRVDKSIDESLQP